MAETKAEVKAEAKKVEETKKADRQKFINRKLRVLNEMSNPAKARYLKERLLNNK